MSGFMSILLAVSVVLPQARHAAELRRHTGIPSVAVSPANGRLWVTFYGGVTPGEDSNSYVPLMTSADDGATWKTLCVAEPEPGRRVFDPELWVAPDGRLRWTLTSRACRAVSVDNLKPYAGDEGDVKSDRLLMAELDAACEPTELPSFRQVADGVMMCKPTVLRDGTWMLPVAHWNAEPSACFFASTDGGKTFVLRGGVSHFPVENRLYDEHTLVELRNGDLLTFIRAKTKPTVLESVSTDKGRTWSVGKAARFAHTSSRHFLRRLKSGNLLLVKNGPVDADVGREWLMAYVSTDDGVTWRGGLVLDGRTGVSYPDGDESADGRLFVVHDCDRLNTQEVLLDIFTEQDVLEGRLVDGRSRLGCMVTRRDAPRASVASTLFRIGANVAEDPEAEAALWRAIDAQPGSFDEVTVFSQGVHSALPLSYHRAQAEKIVRVLEHARQRGLKAGINVLCSCGFFEDEADEAMDAMPWRMGRGGETYRGSLCSGDPKTLKYIEEQYRLYAGAHPDFIYVDDDVSMIGGCYCTNCVRRFAERTKLVPLDADRATLVKALEDTDAVRRRQVREAWLRYCEDRQDGVYAAAVRGVRSVDAKMGVGAMTCTSGATGLATARWAKTLGADVPGAVRWRPGGGCWNDASLDEMLKKAECNAVQTRGLPDGVTAVQAEIENFPYQSLAKSPAFMGFEALTYLGWGCNGLAWNFCSFSTTDYGEFSDFFAKAAAVRPSASVLASAMGTEPSVGVAFPWDGESAADVATASWRGWNNVPIPHELGRIGIPVASELSAAAVTLLDASCVARLDDAALKKILSRGVLMDVGALDAVNARGFGELTGFRTEGSAPRDAIARDLRHPLNLPGENRRDIRASFGWNFSRPSGMVLLAKTDAAAEFTTASVGLRGATYGFAGGVFTNRLGGRIAVEAFLPFTCCEGRPRTEHLKRLMRWLSHETLPGYVVSKHRVALRLRNRCAFAVNMSSSDLSDVEIAVLGDGPCRCTLFKDGVTTDCFDCAATRRDGPYAIYRLKNLPHLGHCLMDFRIEGSGLCVAHASLPVAFSSAQAETAAVVSVKSSRDGTEQPCWFWAPEKAKSEAVPLLVTVHTWSGDYTDFIMYGMALERCRKRGWALVGPNCRGPNKTPEACGSDLAVQDVVDAIAYVQRTVKVDKSRVYMIGASGGGHLTLLMSGRHPELFAATVACCPISDLARWHADSRLDHPGRSARYADMLEAVCGGTPAERPDEYRHRSPLTYLSHAREAGLPVYICTGIHDGWKGSVPVGHSVRAFNALAEANERISEADIAFLESTQTVPAKMRFAGRDPFYAEEKPVLLRRDSQYARLTIFDAAHNGNYDAGFDFLSRQAKGQKPDWTIPAQASAGKTEEVAK